MSTLSDKHRRVVAYTLVWAASVLGLFVYSSHTDDKVNRLCSGVVASNIANNGTINQLVVNTQKSPALSAEEKAQRIRGYRQFKFGPVSC